MRHLVGLAQRIDAFTAAIGRAAAWICLPIALVIMIDVVSRRFFALGSVMLQELEWHLHTVLFLFAAAFAYQRNAHVRIDVFHQRFSERTRAWVELGGCLAFLLPYCAVVGWLSIGFVIRSWEFGEISADPGGLKYRWIIKSAMPLAFAVIFLQGVSVLVQKIVYLSGKDAGDASAREASGG